MLIFGNELPATPLIERIADGLDDPHVDAAWHRIGRVRIRELHADLMDYGLAPAERRELDQLERLLAQQDGLISPQYMLAVFLCLAIGAATILFLWSRS